MSAYSIFLKLEKQKVGSTPLDMTVMKSSWKSMTPAQREPYMTLSREDKESLGLNYRKNRKRKMIDSDKRKSSQSTTPKKIKKKQSCLIQDSSASDPSLVEMLSKLKALDGELASKNEHKYSQRRDLQQLTLKMKSKVVELDELDSSIANYTMKCQVLRKKHESDN